MSLTTANSEDGVKATSERLVAAIERRGIAVLATIDHAAGARAAGLELPDEVVVIFGDASVGTLLMQENPTIGYELPLRILIREEAGRTVLAYRPPTELSGEYPVPEHAEVLERMEQLLAALLAESAVTA